MFLSSPYGTTLDVVLDPRHSCHGPGGRLLDMPLSGTSGFPLIGSKRPYRTDGCSPVYSVYAFLIHPLAEQLRRAKGRKGNPSFLSREIRLRYYAGDLPRSFPTGTQPICSPFVLLCSQDWSAVEIASCDSEPHRQALKKKGSSRTWERTGKNKMGGRAQAVLATSVQKAENA